MKTNRGILLALGLSFLSAVAIGGCSAEPEGNAGSSTGATGATGGAGQGGAGGVAGGGVSGGTAGTAGMAGSAGAAGSGAVAGTGGAAGAGASAGAGGGAGSGGGPGGAAGTGGAGAAGGAGAGGTAGAGGGAGTAGSAGTGGLAGTGGTGGAAGTGGGGGAGGDPAEPARGDIVVDRLVVNQSVQIEVYEGGSVIQPGQRNAPLTSARPMLVQALWKVPGGWTARPILGRLHAKYAGGSEKSFDTTTTVSGASGEGDLSKSIHWFLAKEDVQPEMTFQVRLMEGEPGHDAIPPSAQPPEAPVGSFGDLGVPSDPLAIDIVIVPVKYSSGSCTTDSRSAFTADRLKQWTDYHWARGPMQAVNLTVHAESVSWNGSSWQSVLQSLQQLRVSSNAKPNEYYYAPADSCNTNPEGFGGYSFIADDTKQGASDRVSAGRYVDDNDFTRVTFVHETGHAQGRRHAPCGGPAGPDPSFPYSDGSIGVWAYDFITQTFQDPSEVKDYMTYCYFPSWAADWTYNLHHKKAVTLTSWGTPGPNDASELREVLYGTLPANGSAGEWWTTLGGANPRHATRGEFIEFRLRDGSVARSAAVIKELPEGAGRYLVADVPRDFTSITSIERVSQAKRSAVPLKLRRLIR